MTARALGPSFLSGEKRHPPHLRTPHLVFSKDPRGARGLILAPSTTCHILATMEDDEAPPDLIDVTAMPDQSASIDEEPTTRVPITLVTGMA